MEMLNLLLQINYPILLLQTTPCFLFRQWAVSAGAIGVNKAELVIKMDLDANSVSGQKMDVYPYSNSFAPPAALALGSINEDGTISDLADLGEGSAYYGGNYNSVTHEYRFSIAR